MPHRGTHRRFGDKGIEEVPANPGQTIAAMVNAGPRMRNPQKLEEIGLSNLVSQEGIVISRIGLFAEGPKDIFI